MRPRAAAVAMGLLLTLSWAALLRAVEDPPQVGDLFVYKSYADQLAAGLLPYRDFAMEYPPGALPVIWLPSLWSDYFLAFELLMWAFGAATAALVALTLARVSTEPRRLYAGVAFAALGPLALGSLTLARYDLWPAMLTAAAMLSLVRGAPRSGLGLLALAAGAKIYPFVLVPIALVYVRRERGLREAGAALGVFALVLLLVAGPYLALAPADLVATFERQTGRDLQIESLGAGVLLAGHQLGLITADVTAGLQAISLGGPLADGLASALTVLQGLAVLAVWIVYARGDGGAQRLLLAAAAAVAAFVVFGRVLSPQYLLWLVPLVPLVAGRAGLAASALLGVALLLTREYFQFRYGAVVNLQPAGLLVTVRDLLLLGVFGVLLAALASRRAGFDSP